MSAAPPASSLVRVYWTAFPGLFFDYYDLYLFIYLERTLAGHFSLGIAASHWLQFTGLAGVGAGALGFGYLADRCGRGRTLLGVFGVYALGIAGLSLAWDYGSLLGFRLLASLALGAEWGISHTYLAERVEGPLRYRLSALLQFSLLGGLLAALAARFALPFWGWRVLFAASIPPVGVLALLRWRALLREPEPAEPAPGLPAGFATRSALAAGGSPASAGIASSCGGRPARPALPGFILCLALASLTIAGGTMNVFIAKDLPQSPWYTVLFWSAVAPGMLLGSGLVRRLGVGRTLRAYALALLLLSLACWLTGWSGRKPAFALGLALLNGIPFGLMGAFFNEVFAGHRTMLSGSAYNLGRILAGCAPWLVGVLGLRSGDNYFLFVALLAAGVYGLGRLLAVSGASVPGRPGHG